MLRIATVGPDDVVYDMGLGRRGFVIADRA